MVEKALTEPVAAPVAGEGGQPGAPVPVTPPVVPEPVVDWQVLAKTYEERIAQLTKQAEDSRSREIAQMKQAERDDALRAIAEKQDLLAEAVKSQDWEAYKKSVEEAAQRSTQARLSAEVAATRDKALLRLNVIDTELGGKFEDDPHFEPVALYWRQGLSTGNANFFLEAVAEAEAAARKIERERAQVQSKASLAANTAAIKVAEEAAAKRALEAAGVFEVSAGADAGAGARATNENIDVLWVRFEREHPNQANPYDAQYRVLLGR